MVKIILSISVIIIVFSGCVGTIVGNNKATNPTSNMAKTLHDNVKVDDTVK